MKNLVKYFLEGLLFLVPLLATLYVFWGVIGKIDSLLGLKIQNLLGAKIPGLGFVTTIALITLFGFLASNIFARSIMEFVDNLLNRLPLVKLVYSSVKDLIGAFIGDKKSFDKPVLVSLYPGDGAKVLGFITRESLEEFGLEDQVAVYLPQSYNFAGNLLIFPKDQVNFLATNSSDVMAFIVSGGISGKK